MAWICAATFNQGVMSIQRKLCLCITEHKYIYLESIIKVYTMHTEARMWQHTCGSMHEEVCMWWHVVADMW